MAGISNLPSLLTPELHMPGGKTNNSRSGYDSVELPQLPSKEENNHQMDTMSSAQEADIIEAEQVMNEHLNRVQEAVMDAADKKLETISSQLYHTERDLKITLEEKDHMGVELFKSKKETTRLNTYLMASRLDNERQKEEKRILANLAQQEKQIHLKAISENQKLGSDLKQARSQIDDLRIEIQQLKDINSNYTSDVKIQKRINSKLLKELQVFTEKDKAKKLELEVEREKSTLAKHLLQQQQAEGIAAKMAIQTLHKENSVLEKTVQETEKQWEESLTAMSGRDKAIQSIQDHKQKILFKLSDAEITNRVYKREKSAIETNLSEKEKECMHLTQLNARLRAELKAASKKIEDAAHKISQAQRTELNLTKEIQNLAKTIESKQKEFDLQHKSVAQSGGKDDHEIEKIVTEKLRAQAGRIEDRMKEQTDHLIKVARRESEEKNISIRYELANLKLFNLRKEANSLRETNGEFSKNYVTVSDNAKQMNYQLERKEHELNLTKAKTNQIERDNKDTFETSMNSLQKELNSKKAEVESLKALWLEAQKHLVAEQGKYKKLATENENLNTKLGISDGVKARAGNEMQIIKSESLEHKHETAALYNELKKKEPIIIELKEYNLMLESKLHDLGIKLQESYANHSTTKQMLQTEIRRLGQDRSILRQERSSHDRAIMNGERDTQLHKEIIEKLKSEKYELQRELYSMKRKSDASDKKYFDLKIKLRQLEKIEVNKRIKKSFGEADQGQGRGAKWNSFKTLDSFSEVPGSGASVTSPKESPSVSEKIIQDLPDFDAIRLKIESLENEKKFLLEENSELEQRLSQMNSKMTETAKTYNDTKNMLKEVNLIRSEQMQRLEVMDQRYARAKKVAAHMERQIKDLKPNTKIDYMMPGAAEPSTQLLAALLAKDVKLNLNGKMDGRRGGAGSKGSPVFESKNKRATLIADTEMNKFQEF